MRKTPQLFGPMLRLLTNDQLMLTITHPKCPVSLGIDLATELRRRRTPRRVRKPKQMILQEVSK